MPRARTKPEPVRQVSEQVGPAPEKGWRVEIPGYLPPTINVLMRGHWAKRARAKKLATNRIAMECKLAGVPVADRKRRVALTLVVTNRSHAPDPDAPYKAVLDGLKRAGALVDDSQEWCEPMTPRIVRGPARLTVIDLEDC